jgi:hypothetical protein
MLSKPGRGPWSVRTPPLGVGMKHNYCYMKDDHEKTFGGVSFPQGLWRAAIAHVTVPSSMGTYIGKLSMCRRHLNAWLDAADDNPKLEPIKIEWLNSEN